MFDIDCKYLYRFSACCPPEDLTHTGEGAFALNFTSVHLPSPKNLSLWAPNRNQRLSGGGRSQTTSRTESPQQTHKITYQTGLCHKNKYVSIIYIIIVYVCVFRLELHGIVPPNLSFFLSSFVCALPVAFATGSGCHLRKWMSSMRIGTKSFRLEDLNSSGLKTRKAVKRHHL